MVTCITCKHFTLRLSSTMAKVGFGNCGTATPWKFESATFERTCEKHDPAAEHLVSGRQDWLNKQKEKAV